LFYQARKGGLVKIRFDSSTFYTSYRAQWNCFWNVYTVPSNERSRVSFSHSSYSACGTS